MNGKPVEFMVSEYAENGMVLDGWILSVNGQELGILKFGGEPTGPISRQVFEFKPLATKYGVFDAQQVRNLNLAAMTDTFTITLDGNYVGTVSGTI